MFLCTPAIVYLLFGLISLVKKPFSLSLGSFNTKNFSNSPIIFVTWLANVILFGYTLSTTGTVSSITGTGLGKRRAIFSVIGSMRP